MPTISAFFLFTVLVQMPMLGWFGILDLHRLLLSCAATLVLLAFMPVGSALAKRLRPEIFDRTILILLTVLACRLIFEAFATV